MKFKFKNIDFYFRSSCCNTENESPMSCERAPQITSKYLCIEKYQTYIMSLCERKVQMVKGTITIGNQWLGRKSAEDQYTEFVEAIKRFAPRGSGIEYLAHFELTKSGVLHSHLLIINCYQQHFSDSFAHFGVHNTKGKSFIVVDNKRGIGEYLQYINKENVFPWITNITKKNIILEHTQTP